MVVEEIAQSNEPGDLPEVVWWWHITEQLKFFPTRSNAFWCEDKSQVGHLVVAEEAFSQVDLELVFFELGHHLVKHLQVMLMSGRVDDDIVDVDDDVADAI